MSRDPLISVVMTSYNYACYIEEAIKSVWRQNYPNLELIVVDDASTDGTIALLEELAKHSPIPMRIDRNQENRGPNFTQNRGVSVARGELIAFLASDDWYAADRFQSQLRLFEQNPDLMIVYGNGWSFKNGEIVSRLHNEDVKDLLSRGPECILRYLYTHTSPFYLQTVLVKKAFLLECGGNDERVLADDWVLNIRFFEALIRAGHFAYVDEDTAYYRLHGENLHRNYARQVALKKEVIQSYTPRRLRSEALANIYRKQASIALAQDCLLSGLNFFLLSLAYGALSRAFFKEAL
jgi:alpha-1,3-rhamnosyltransferase